MSLVGNLEDLGLGDILQIVSLSQKSGILTLQSGDCEGRVYFANGQVVRALSTCYPLNLGDLLVHHQIVSLDTIKQALTTQRDEDGRRCLGTILAEDFAVRRERIEQIVRQQLETIIFRFFSWREGTFSFELGDPRIFGDAAVNPLAFMFAKGLNPQWLALEGSKLLDEGGFDATEESVETREPVANWSEILAEPASESAAAADTAQRRTIFFIDDDAATRAVLQHALQRAGYEVYGFDRQDLLIKAYQRALSEGRRPLVLIDLIMPRQSGQGVLGGFELAETLRVGDPESLVVLMSDHPHAVDAAQVQKLHVPAVLDKPKKLEILERRYQEVLERLVAGLDSICSNYPGGAAVDARVNIAGDLVEELGDDHYRPLHVGSRVPGLTLLKGLMSELANPGPVEHIPLLVLRFASELLSRAVILVQRGEVLCESGHFGFSEEVVRRGIRIPIKALTATPFADILQTPRAIRLAGPDQVPHWPQLGPKVPSEVFFGVIVAEQRPVAYLYGDNVNDGKPIGDTSPLEIFLAQAGLAMDKALLEQKLQRHQPGSVPGAVAGQPSVRV